MECVPIDASEILILACPECQFMTLKVASLDTHLKEHDCQIQVKLNKCKQCGMITNSEKVIEEHVQIWHPSKDVNENVAVVFDETYNQDKPTSSAGARGKRSAAADAHKDSNSKPSTNVAGLPQINLLQLMYMAHGPVEINLPGSYQLDKTKDGVPGCISFMPSFLNKTVGEQFLDVLKQELAWKQLSATMKDGKERQDPRLTCYIGPDFSFCGNKFENCNEWNPKLRELKELVEKAVGRQFNAVICYMFRHGRDSVGFHSELDKPLGEHPYIAAVTLGQPRYMEFLRKGREDRLVRLRASHGDLLITEGAIEDLWVHRVPKDQMARRTSYTFSFRNVYPVVEKKEEAPAKTPRVEKEKSAEKPEKPAAPAAAEAPSAAKAEAAASSDEAPAAAAGSAASPRPGSGDKKGKSPGPVGSGKAKKAK